MSQAMRSVMAAEEAMEACLKCVACQQPMESPKTCTPCGHTFCAKCIPPPSPRTREACAHADGEMAACPQCGGPPSRVVAVPSLAGVANKFATQKKVLEQSLDKFSMGGVATAARAVSRMNHGRVLSSNGSGGAPVVVE